jgi:hypothetical protein
MASINQELNASGLGAPAVRALRRLFMAALDTSNSAAADLALIAGKLDDDATVTDTDYEATLTTPTNSGGLTE